MFSEWLNTGHRKISSERLFNLRNDCLLNEFLPVLYSYVTKMRLFNPRRRILLHSNDHSNKSAVQIKYLIYMRVNCHKTQCQNSQCSIIPKMVSEHFVLFHFNRSRIFCSSYGTWKKIRKCTTSNKSRKLPDYCAPSVPVTRKLKRNEKYPKQSWVRKSCAIS